MLNSLKRGGRAMWSWLKRNWLLIAVILALVGYNEMRRAEGTASSSGTNVPSTEQASQEGEKKEPEPAPQKQEEEAGPEPEQAGSETRKVVPIPVTTDVGGLRPVAGSVPLVSVPQRGDRQEPRKTEEALVRQVFNLGENPENRRQAVKSLASYRYGRVAKVLAEKILPGDPDKEVRKEAAKSLAEVGNEHFLPALERAAADAREDPEVQEEAKKAISRIKERAKRFGPSPALPSSASWRLSQ